MLHSHTYYKWPSVSSASVMKSAALTTCPSGHTNCIVSSYNTSAVPYYTAAEVGNTFLENDNLHHVHKYYILISPSIISIPILTMDTCPLGHSRCRTGETVDRDFVTATLHPEDTSDAIWTGDDHRHTYDWTTSTSWGTYFIGVTTCPLGHGNCRLVSLSGAFKPYLDEDGDLVYAEYNSGWSGISTSFVETLPATYVTQNSATLNGKLWSAGDFYCGFVYWESANPGTSGTIWYNSPSPEHLRSPISGEQEFSAPVQNLKVGTWYSFKALAYDLTDYYYGNVLTFQTEAETPVFGSGQGYDYKTPKQASKHVAQLAIGRMYVDSEGNINYESRNVRA